MNNEGQIPTLGDNTNLLESMHHDDLLGDQGDDFANLEDYDSEGDISITIGEVTPTPFDKRIPLRPTESADHKMDQSDPNFKNMLIYDLDPVSIDDRPWNKPGADITDYFNYGFVEETWNVYRERQRRMRQESTKMQRDGVLTHPHLADVGGIMVLNSDSALISDSSMMPLMNPPSMMGPPGTSSLDFHRMQTPFFPGGHQIHPNYFMGARFGMRPLGPPFQPQMMPGDRNPRFQPPPIVSPSPIETKYEDSPGKNTPRRHKEKGRRRRSMSESSREERSRKRKRGGSREKTKHVSRGRRHDDECKTKDRR